MPSITVELRPIPPFRLDLTAWVLRRRPDYAVDQWDGRCYRRAFPLAGDVVDVAIQQVGTDDVPRLELAMTGSSAVLDQRAEVIAVIERLMGLGVDLRAFYAFADRDPVLGPLARRFRGFKPTRYPSLFECLTNAIACQQVTLVFGLQVVSRLAAAYGLAVERDDGVAHAFPTPAAIAAADPEHLREIGFSRQKARATIELAQGLSNGSIDFSGIEQASDGDAIAQLTALRGVGRWTAEYTLLRGLARYHIFPGDDVGARNTLRRWIESEAPLDYNAVNSTLSDWYPYGGLLYFHMLLLGLDAKGQLSPDG